MTKLVLKKYVPYVHAGTTYASDYPTNNYCIRGWSRSTYGTANLKEKNRPDIQPFDIESIKKLANQKNHGN
jgi:hypothetical protein